jgi:hypothetical protein
MSRINRPHYVSLEKEREFRKTMSTIGKLQAVKDMKDFSKSFVSSTNLDGTVYQGLGLKECKEYIDQLEAWKDPINELKVLHDQTRDFRKMLPVMLREAFPGISDDTINRALTDDDFLDKIVNTASVSQEFGI